MNSVEDPKVTRKYDELNQVQGCHDFSFGARMLKSMTAYDVEKVEFILVKLAAAREELCSTVRAVSFSICRGGNECSG